MSQLFEVIKVQNRLLQNVGYHTERVKRSYYKIFRAHPPFDLLKEIKIPENFDDAIYKCRMIYSSKIDKIEFEPYQSKTIRSLKVVHYNNIDYSVKYYDRSLINKLYQLRGDSDDILIIKDGSVTDISFANIVFWDGSKWITPSTPLLPGTKRQKLIDEKKIIKKEIKINDLNSFQKARIINAMIDLSDSADIFEIKR